VTNSWQDDYSAKRRTAEEVLRLIRSGQRIFIGSSCGEPQHLVNALLLGTLLESSLSSSASTPRFTWRRTVTLRWKQMFISFLVTHWYELLYSLHGLYSIATVGIAPRRAS
jgi:hypothetical protein